MRQELAEITLAREKQMLDRLCAAVKEFYSNDKNMQAYLAWKNKEEKQNGNYNQNGVNRKES